MPGGFPSTSPGLSAPRQALWWGAGQQGNPTFRAHHLFFCAHQHRRFCWDLRTTAYVIKTTVIFISRYKHTTLRGFRVCFLPQARWPRGRTAEGRPSHVGSRAAGPAPRPRGALLPDASAGAAVPARPTPPRTTRRAGPARHGPVPWGPKTEECRFCARKRLTSYSSYSAISVDENARCRCEHLHSEYGCTPPPG